MRFIRKVRDVWMAAILYASLTYLPENLKKMTIFNEFLLKIQILTKKLPNWDFKEIAKENLSRGEKKKISMRDEKKRRKKWRHYGKI